MKKEMNSIKSIVSNVDGWLTDEEGELLFNLAKQCTGKGVIVEIGSWKGKSTIWLGKGSVAGNHIDIFAIDPHTGSSEHHEMFGNVWTFREFQDNVKNAGLSDIINPIVKTSQEAAGLFNEPVELIFIDGAHEYELVKQDYQTWFPKIINGGTIALHDTLSWEGPTKVVEEFILQSTHFNQVRIVDSITVAQKVQANTWIDRIQGKYIFSYALFLIKVASLIGKLKLPSVIRIFLKSTYKFIRRFTQ